MQRRAPRNAARNKIGRRLLAFSRGIFQGKPNYQLALEITKLLAEKQSEGRWWDLHFLLVYAVGEIINRARRRSGGQGGEERMPQSRRSWVFISPRTARTGAQESPLSSGTRKILGRTLDGKPARLRASFANFGAGVPRRGVRFPVGVNVIPEWKLNCKRTLFLFYTYARSLYPSASPQFPLFFFFSFWIFFLFSFCLTLVSVCFIRLRCVPRRVVVYQLACSSPTRSSPLVSLSLSLDPFRKQRSAGNSKEKPSLVTLAPLHPSLRH